jgi:hypothetical protein
LEASSTTDEGQHLGADITNGKKDMDRSWLLEQECAAIC